MTHLLVTGAAGFIGSHFVDLVLAERPDVTALTGLDKLGYAGDERNLALALRDDRFRFVKGDVTDGPLVTKLAAEAEEIAHFAAETMVDRSVTQGKAFLEANIIGTGNVLDAARHSYVRRMLYISTPEVYGQRVETAAEEEDIFSPRNIYAASKAAAEMLVSAYRHSFRLPVVITRGSSAVGPRQHPEKVTPRLITSALMDEPLPVYGDGSARRDFVNVDDLNRANELILRVGTDGRAYNVATGEERTILELALGILDRLGKSRHLVSFTDDRVAHDLHYRMRNAKLMDLGWKPQMSFERTLDDTVSWYEQNADWWLPKVQSDDFQRYLASQAEARRRHS